MSSITTAYYNTGSSVSAQSQRISYRVPDLDEVGEANLKDLTGLVHTRLMSDFRSGVESYKEEIYGDLAKKTEQVSLVASNVEMLQNIGSFMEKFNEMTEYIETSADVIDSMKQMITTQSTFIEKHLKTIEAQSLIIKEQSLIIDKQAKESGLSDSARIDQLVNEVEFLYRIISRLSDQQYIDKTMDPIYMADKIHNKINKIATETFISLNQQNHNHIMASMTEINQLKVLNHLQTIKIDQILAPIEEKE